MAEIGGHIFIAPGEETDIELVVKRSRFIASLRLAPDMKSANATLKTFSALYPKANHHCWAYRIGIELPQEHCSDDGEPTGTAGRPILGVLKRHSLNNTLLVVTRYFGGVKLGVRGLIEAYCEAAELAAGEAGTVEMELHNRLELECDYGYVKTLSAALKKWGVTDERRQMSYGESVRATLEVPCSIRADIAPMFEEMRLRGFLTKLNWGDELLMRPKFVERARSA